MHGLERTGQRIVCKMRTIVVFVDNGVERAAILADLYALEARGFTSDRYRTKMVPN